LVPQVAVRARGAGRLEADLLIWLGVIGAAWIAASWLEASGAAHLLHHHTIYHSGRLLAGGLALLGAWQVMTAAMMLPGALPAVRRIGRISGRLSPVAAQLVFLAVYAAAWTGFAMVAFVADMGLHAMVHGWPLAARYESLIPAAVLGAAALYQVSPWKGASLCACRRAAETMGRYEGGSLRDILMAGVTYSRHCLVSGWALMLIMFSAGVADLTWMAALALTMLAEKALPSGDRLRFVVAGTLALLAAATLAGGGPAV
jgi:predicted metal-binding membrane protein